MRKIYDSPRPRTLTVWLLCCIIHTNNQSYIFGQLALLTSFDGVPLGHLDNITNEMRR